MKSDTVANSGLKLLQTFKTDSKIQTDEKTIEIKVP